jgi:Protein of unknown function (DUF3465)
VQKPPTTNKRLLKLFLLILLSIASAFLASNRGNFNLKPLSPSAKNDLTDLDSVKAAFENQKSNFQVKQVGQIVKILREDTYSPRHQRFIVQLSSGQKLLIAHNIELAPRVEGVKEGAAIAFYGEYEWNNKGGVVHWTHHDPKGSHPGGWLLYNDHKYD